MSERVFSETEGSPRLPSASFARVAQREQEAGAYITLTVSDAQALAARGGGFPVSGDFAAQVRAVVDL